MSMFIIRWFFFFLAGGIRSVMKIVKLSQCPARQVMVDIVQNDLTELCGKMKLN